MTPDLFAEIVKGSTRSEVDQFFSETDDPSVKQGGERISLSASSKVDEQFVAVSAKSTASSANVSMRHYKVSTILKAFL